jgi:hypothetical protein
MEANQNDREKREYYLDMLDPERKNVELATMDMVKLTAFFEKQAGLLADVSIDKYMDLYKTNSTKKKEDELRIKNYQLEQREITLNKLQRALLAKRDELEIWESNLKQRETRLKSPGRAHEQTQFNYHPSTSPRGIQNDVRTTQGIYSGIGVRPPIPSRTERLIDDSNYYQNFGHHPSSSGIPDYPIPSIGTNPYIHEEYPQHPIQNSNVPDDYDEEEAYQAALKESLEEGLKFVDKPSSKPEEQSTAKDTTIETKPAIEKPSSKYSFMPTKPDDIPDEIIDNMYELLKKEDYKGARSYMSSPSVSVKAVQWFLSLEYGGSKFKQMIATSDASICKLFENPN